MKAALCISHIESSLEHLYEFINGKYLPYLNEHCKGMNIEIGTIEEAAKEPYTLVLVASGGPIRDFYDICSRTDGPYILLTNQYDNSIAAALEMKAYLDSIGEKGEIVYGEMDEVAERLVEINKVLTARKRLEEMKFGLIGAERDEQGFSPDAFTSSFGSEITCIPFDELLSEIRKNTYEPNALTERLLSHAPNRNEMLNALYVYGAVKRIADRRGLKAFALKCFDLLPYKVTGCTALALLNTEGYYGACEGDMRSLVSMAVLGEVSGEHVFMANPCQVNRKKNNMVFAHCTLPLDMVPSYDYSTHYESGLSVAYAGHFDKGEYTVFKCNENLESYSVHKGDWVSSPSDPLLCRTQIELHFDDVSSFFVHPINNHQMICHGDHVRALEDFFSFR